MESSFTYCSQWVIADCFFLTLVMSNTDVIISCILTNWAGKKRKNSQKYNTVLMSRIFLEKNEPLWVWFLGHEEKWGINSKLGALSSLTCSTYTKIGTIQRRLAWPLRKDDTQIREAFHIFYTPLRFLVILSERSAEKRGGNQNRNVLFQSQMWVGSLSVKLDFDWWEIPSCHQPLWPNG